MRMMSEREMSGPRQTRTFPWGPRDDVRNLCLRGVLAECSEQVAQHLARYRPSSLLVKERKRLLVLCVSRMHGSVVGLFPKGIPSKEWRTRRRTCVIALCAPLSFCVRRSGDQASSP